MFLLAVGISKLSRPARDFYSLADSSKVVEQAAHCEILQSFSLSAKERLRWLKLADWFFSVKVYSLEDNVLVTIDAGWSCQILIPI